ncbi:hypothetical protein OE88DRAFT_1652261 [Heliocybe sulcata]|uniref:Uncharacterized protein n=1 Tax=Heliocybe sulcata TaxID=5364 RepID=A0A5C3NEN1_9AGAM|nr:hypothetical protein OE88DRAFT_1652261 [Heliocybe sulcata]
MKSLSAFVNLLKNKNEGGGKSSRKEKCDGEDLVSYLPGLLPTHPRVSVITPPTRSPSYSKSRASTSSLRSSKSVPAFRDGSPGKTPERKGSPLSKDTQSQRRPTTGTTPRARKSSFASQKRPATSPLDKFQSRTPQPSPLSSLSDLVIDAEVDQIRSSHLETFTPENSPLVERPVIPIIILQEDEDDLYSSRCVLESTSSVPFPRPTLSEAEFRPSFLDLGGGSENDDDDDWNYYDEELGVDIMDAHCSVRKGKSRRRRRRISIIPPVPTMPPPQPPADVDEPASSSKPKPQGSARTRVLLEMFPDVPSFPRADRPHSRRPSTSPASHLPFAPKRHPSAVGSASQVRQPRQLRRSISADALGVLGGIRRQEMLCTPEQPNSSLPGLPTIEVTEPSTPESPEGRRSSNGSSDYSSSTASSVVGPVSPPPTIHEFPIQKGDHGRSPYRDLPFILAPRDTTNARKRVSMVSECGSIRWGVAV